MFIANHIYVFNNPAYTQKKKKKNVYRHYIEKNTYSKSLCMFIANHIYVFNNPAYTTKTTPLIFKNKNKKMMFIDII
jgi:hypothetical protein